MDEIPENHPRAQSLRSRHKIIQGMHDQIVAEAGLIAHGRGEAFDYLLGEQTHNFAIEAISAAAAQLYLAEKPILSVNGNVVALCLKDMVKFSNLTGIPLEINLFYKRPERIEAISKRLQEAGAKDVYGVEPQYLVEINEISSQRRAVDSRGISIADVVFVPLEDGDRTEGLIKNNKKVITVDLNPLSRTAQKANITVVDNIERVFPLLLQAYLQMTNDKANSLLDTFDNHRNLTICLETISRYWKD